MLNIVKIPLNKHREFQKQGLSYSLKQSLKKTLKTDIYQGSGSKTKNKVDNGQEARIIS